MAHNSSIILSDTDSEALRLWNMLFAIRARTLFPDNEEAYKEAKESFNLKIFDDALRPLTIEHINNKILGPNHLSTVRLLLDLPDDQYIRDNANHKVINFAGCLRESQNN